VSSDILFMPGFMKICKVALKLLVGQKGTDMCTHRCDDTINLTFLVK